MWVYPRACGATHARRRSPQGSSGLSPRMRGNLIEAIYESYGFRSIPAHAGQPPCNRPSPNRCAVYPRACGATCFRGRGLFLFRGLSPRMRGNRRCAISKEVSARSIPAHAGQPSRYPLRDSGSKVYPRACGATCAWRLLGARRSGLSPRMRGNHNPPVVNTNNQRSIPAHAGQPSNCPLAKREFAVYPRACGATEFRDLIARACKGLSPRMRGNHSIFTGAIQIRRSIPAHAGQPYPGRLHVSRPRVYPRACGAT